jgi:O-antigen ligase
MKLLSPAGLLAVAAASAPSLLAYNVAPSPTFLNQALACALWGAFVAAAALAAKPATRAPAGAGRGPAPLQAALLLMLLAVAGSWAGVGLPASLALSAAALLAAAALLVASGAAQRGAAPVFVLFCAGWVVAGVFNVGIAVVQVFAPQVPDGDWIARSGIVGRAVGNLRQPNHLSSLLLWSAIAVVALLEVRRLSVRWALPLFAAMLFAVVLTASRTGLVSVGLLALWGLLDRRLSWPGRALLIGSPLLYALAWFGMAAWADASAHTFGGAARLAETDVSGSRFGIWANSLELIRQNPWTGVGFGEFNYAWTLTPFPGRPTALFDHAHNLPLHLAVELGLPLAGAVMALLLWALWRAAASAWATGGGADGAAQRSALMMVLMIGLHSLLEYPLWYAYFLLPAAWAWGFALGRGAITERRSSIASRPAPALVLGGVVLALGSVWSVADYQRVAAIFSAPADAPPLAQRILAGQRSVLFAHHADYAAATTEGALPGTDPLAPFERATHYLLDTRLMMAWSRALAAAGQDDPARAIAQRLREFRNPLADEFFDVCEPAAAASAAASAPNIEAAFQCEPPARAPGWREFLPR